ncbi:hypothetical protein OG848_08320 [Streptomyces canus]|uniref:hypothetical protein n=1 Tax=Streptomyces canus TaxID=58343 RepID=UPI0032551F7D
MDAEDSPVMLDDWTGRTAEALQFALRMTNDEFAEHLGVAVRTVAGWHEAPDIVPRRRLQQLLDVVYERISGPVLRRFQARLGARQTSPVVMAAEMTLMQARIDELQQQLAAKGSRP